jgi:hypothetical protein
MDPASEEATDRSPLSKSRITQLPADFYYIPNFLTDLECDAILNKASYRTPS